MGTFRNRGWLILVLFTAFVATGCGCGDDDDDNDSASPDDDTTDDDTVDDDADDDADDDTGDDDTWPPLPDDDADDDTGDDDDTYPTTEGFEYIPAGSFSMGSPSNEPGRNANEALHDVTITRHFEMMATEVRQDLFDTLLGFNPSHFPLVGDSPDRPVDQVTWYDALAFANALSVAHDFAPCFEFDNIVCEDDTAVDDAADCAAHGGVASADVTTSAASVVECEGFRLPTEAEWEYAARAGSTSAFYNGDITHTACSPLDPNLDAIAWYCANSNNYTHPVGRKAPNDWGLFDMLGNVKEWTWDGYSTDPADGDDPAESIDDHLRSVRGGSARWDGALRLRAAHRQVLTPDRRDRFAGFRVARTLPPDKGAAFFTAPRAIDVAPPPVVPRALPTSLPFAYTRTDVGTPLTEQEIDDFTAAVTGLLADVDYFNWMRRLAHGMAADNVMDSPDYKLHLQDFGASKSGDVVTYAHGGASDNLMIQTGKIINNVAALYLATGDDTIGELLTDLCKGVQALFWGMAYDEEDPETTIMVRTLFPFNHSYEVDGRDITVNYDGAKHYSYDWNAHTVPNETNPYYGPIWVRNWRSKDDVPHIFRTVPMLSYVAQDGEDADVRDAAEDALAALRGFAKDITDSGYHIRTKDEWGNAEVPINPDNGLVADLASFVLFDPLAPNGECDAKLSAALIGYDDPMGNDCNDGAELIYETVATLQHYYNYAIIRYFHLSALGLALVSGENDAAEELMDGMAYRVDRMMNHQGSQSDDPAWDVDTASYCVAAASYGLPLTSAEAQQVVEFYTKAVDLYEDWAYWDPWDGSVPDGPFPYEPSRNGPDGLVPPHEEFLYLFEYCQSPFRNDAGAEFIDCDVLLDPTQW